MRVADFRGPFLGRLRKGSISVGGFQGQVTNTHQFFLFGHGMVVIPRNELELAPVEVD